MNVIDDEEKDNLNNLFETVSNKDIQFNKFSKERAKILDFFETEDKFRDLFQKVKENIGMFYNF